MNAPNRATADQAQKGNGLAKSAESAGRPGRLSHRQAVSQAAGVARRHARRAARRGGRPARPQRRRQDHLLLHHHRPDQRRHGPIQLDGDDDHRRCRCTARARLGIGYLPQEASIFRGLTVEREHPRGARGGRAATRERDATASTSCWRSSPSRHLRRTPGDRAVGRRAAARRDRPRAGVGAELHPARRAAWPASIRSPSTTSAISWSHLKDRGIGVLITDHNVRETLDIVDRAYILHEGQVLMEGHAGGDRRRRGRAPRLSRRTVQSVGARAGRPWRLSHALDLRQARPS